MAADANLIKGAYAAAGAGEADLAAAKGMTEIADTIAKPVAEELGARRDEFNEFVEWEMNRQPGLNEANYDQRIDDLMQMKADFIWGDNASRAKIMRHMGDMKAQQDAMEGAINDFAKSGDNKTDGFTPKFKQSPEAQAIAKAAKDGKWAWIDGKYKLATEQNGETVYYSQEDLNRLNKEFSFDSQSKTVFDAYLGDLVDRADKSDAYNFVPFDYETERGKIFQIVNQGSAKSMALDDKFIPGRVFKDDLVEALKNGTYEDLGIDMGDIQAVDPDSDGDGLEFVSDSDAETISNALINNPTLVKEYLTDYFTEHSKRNWEKTQYRNKRSISQSQQKTDAANITNLSKQMDKLNIDLKLPINIKNQFDEFGNRTQQTMAIKDMNIQQLENARDILTNSYGKFAEGSPQRAAIDKLIQIMDQRENQLNKFFSKFKTISPDQI